jgi:hypothetical protein
MLKGNAHLKKQKNIGHNAHNEDNVSFCTCNFPKLTKPIELIYFFTIYLSLFILNAKPLEILRIGGGENQVVKILPC